MIESLIRFVLSNFTLTFLIIGLIASVVAYLSKPHPRSRAQLVEALFSYFLLFSIGFSFLYNFVMHVFFGEVAARFIGWADSPFQTEVGFASLGFAAVGFLAFRGRPVALPSRRRGRSYLPDDRGTEFRTRQCRDHLLDRYPGSSDRVRPALSAGEYP
jgi:hypothetical protein